MIAQRKTRVLLMEICGFLSGFIVLYGWSSPDSVIVREVRP